MSKHRHFEHDINWTWKELSEKPLPWQTIWKVFAKQIAHRPIPSPFAIIKTFSSHRESTEVSRKERLVRGLLNIFSYHEYPCEATNVGGENQK